jgi:hypothetical protein
MSRFPDDQMSFLEYEKSRLFICMAVPACCSSAVGSGSVEILDLADSGSKYELMELKYKAS